MFILILPIINIYIIYNQELKDMVTDALTIMETDAHANMETDALANMET